MGALGVRVREGVRIHRGGPAGLGVTKVVEGSAADGLLRAGDLIEEVNGQTVQSSADVGRALRKGDGTAVFVVRRKGAQMLVQVPLD